MLTEDFCSFEVAKLLKEKGFDELCIFKYNSEGVRMKAGVAIDEWQNSELDDNEYSCPSQSMAMKWLREVHNLHVDSSIYTDTDGDSEHEYTYTYWDWLIFNSESGRRIAEPQIGCGRYDSYEQACEAAIKYCLENLI